MKKKSFNALTIVTLLVVVAAAYAVRQRSATKAAPEQYGTLFEGLGKRLNDVAELQVVQGDKTLTIRRDGGEWGVVERAGYHAKFDRVKETLVGLAELDVLEPKTSRPDRYAGLGVQEAGVGSESRRLTLKDGSGAVLADLIVGNAGGQGGVFVRKPDEPQAFLCEGELEVSTDPSSWIDRDILRVDSKEVAEVRVQHHDGEEVHVVALDEAASKFKIANLPQGRSERYEGAANGVATALQSLTLDDVRPVAEIDFTADPIATGKYRRKDGEELTLHLARQDEKIWVRVTSEYVSPSAPAAPAEGAETVATPEAPVDPVAEGVEEIESQAMALELAARQRVAEHNERLAPWAFAIPEWKSTAIAKRMEELLLAVETGPPAPEEAGDAELPLAPTPTEDGATDEDPEHPQHPENPADDGSIPDEGAEDPGEGATPPSATEDGEEPAATEEKPRS